METTDTFKKNMADDVIAYFNGTDMHLVLDTLSTTLNHHLHSVIKDCDLSSDSSKRELVSEVWDVTNTMVFLAKLHYSYTMQDK